MSIGKDGTPFNINRWVNWAIGGDSHFQFNKIRNPQSQANAARHLKRKGGTRRECKCTRMIPAASKTCPFCGAKK